MQWKNVTIGLPRGTRVRRAYATYARKLRDVSRSSAHVVAIMRLQQQMLDSVAVYPTRHQATLRACALILADLVLQNWRVRVTQNDEVFVRLPENSGCRDSVRSAIRHQELLKRDEQLSKPSVRAFVAAMERKRLHKNRFVSIYDLMRDGQELSESLRNARTSPRNGDALEEIVKPYVQFVDAKERCEFTGLRLMDIWRYFRHTWTNQYSTVPGRNMMILVRDAAAENHPVMGIASLCSPIIQISERDKWLGWHPDTFLDRVRSQPSAKLARWLLSTVDAAIDEIYVADFISDGLISRWAIANPNPNAIEKLRTYSTQQKKRHQRYSKHADFKQSLSDEHAKKHWRKQARTPLFKSKRAQSLADLLELRSQLDSHFGSQYSTAKLRTFVETANGRRVIKKIVRKAKADRVGIAMADINVCGAVQPYNAILGGKLVSMLAVSPRVVEQYRQKYSNAVSQIASSMAGRPIVRRSDLVVLGTTALYGNGSSQYNRIKIPANVLNGSSEEAIKFKKIGDSESFGTSQFSNRTVDAIVECLRQSTNGERVNSIFGEGVSPKLRKIREGLSLLGFPEQSLLQHQRRRSVYGISLVKNLENYLLGLEKRPRYICPTGPNDTVDAIVAWWRHRWLSGRIQSDAVLQQVAKHQHVHPIQHGARVPVGGLAEPEVDRGVL